jgi:hypothetical protein
VNRGLAAVAALFVLALAPDASAGLVAQYSIDSLPADGSVADSSPNGLNGGARQGDAIADGRFGGAIRLAGAVGDGFNVTNNPLLEPRRLTVAAWVRKGGPFHVFRTVVGKGGEGCSSSTWALYTAANGGLAFYVNARDANGQQAPLETPPIPPEQIWDNQWHAIAGTFDGTEVALWVDGVKVASAEYPGRPVNELDYARQTMEKRLQIGRYDEAGCSASGFQFFGDIDEVRLYDRVLSNTELATLQDPAATEPPVIPDPPPGTPPPPPPAAPPPPLAAFAQVAKSPVIKAGTTFDASGSVAPDGTKIVTYDWNVDSDPEPDVSCDAGQPAMTVVFPRNSAVRVAAARNATVSLTVTASDLRTGLVSVSQPLSTSASVTTSPLVRQPVFACGALATGNGVSALRGQCTKRIVFSIVEVTATGNGKCFFLTLSKSYALKDFTGNSLGSRDAQLGRLPAPVANTDTKSVTATVEGPVSVNGIRLPLPSKTKTTYDLGTATLGLGRVPVEVGVPGLDKPIKLTELDLNKKVEVDPTGRYSLGSAKVESPGIKGLGGLKLGAGAEFALRRGFKSELKLALTLPNIFNDGQGKGVTGTVTVLGTHDGGFAFEGARLQIPFAAIGPIALSKLFFDYQHTNEQLTGGFNVQLLPGFGPVILASPEDGYGLQLRNGSFYAGGFGVEFPVAPQVFPGIGLNNVGANFGVDPLRLTGRLGLAFGETLVIDGTAFIALASKTTPYDFPAEFAPPGLGFLGGRRLDSFSAAIGATASLKLPVLGKVKLNDGYVFYAHPGLVEAGGNVDLAYKVGKVELSIAGKVGGFFDTEAKLYNFEGEIKGCVKIDLPFPFSEINPCLNTGGIVSSKGIGFCGLAVLPYPFPQVPIPVGAGREWNGGASVKVFSCDYGAYRQENKRAAGQRQGKAAQAGNAVKLPAGLPGAMIRVTGRGGAPRVTVTPPGGTAIALPQTDPASANRNVVSFSDTEGTTTIALRRPAKGTWRIGVQSGSPPIAKVETAEALPAPKVTASVGGSGAHRKLRYRIDAAPGQSVTFVERGRRTYSRIGEARGSSGTLRFTSADGAAEGRRILAIVERGGIARTLTVARYAAPGTARPAAPKALRAQRRGTTISVAFRRVRGAEQYRVAWRPSIGVPATVLTRRPQARITSVDRLIPGTVTVTALKLDARPSVPARVRIATPKRRAKRR